MNERKLSLFLYMKLRKNLVKAAQKPGLDLDKAIYNLKQQLLKRGYSPVYAEEICLKLKNSFIKSQNSSDKIPPRQVKVMQVEEGILIESSEEENEH